MKMLSTALLVLFSTATRTRVVASHLLFAVANRFDFGRVLLGAGDGVLLLLELFTQSLDFGLEFADGGFRIVVEAVDVLLHF